MIAIFDIAVFIIDIIKRINKETETKILSDEAYVFLMDRKNCDELNKSIDEYKKTGKWNHKFLKIK